MPSPDLPRIVTISTHIYSRVLWLCPRRYRREYGALMAQAFRDICCDTYRKHGAEAVFGLWLRTLWDVGTTAAVEHLSGVKAEPLRLQAAGAMLLVLLLGAVAVATGQPFKPSPSTPRSPQHVQGESQWASPDIIVVLVDHQFTHPADALAAFSSRWRVTTPANRQWAIQVTTRSGPSARLAPDSRDQAERPMRPGGMDSGRRSG